MLSQFHFDTREEYLEYLDSIADREEAIDYDSLRDDQSDREYFY